MAYIKKEPIVEFITKGLNNPDKTKAYGYDAIEILAEIEYTPTADVVEIEILRDWLWDIALNNVGCAFDGDFSIACQDIISMLGGLRSFAKERAVNYESSKTEKR